ncbi:MAG: hypothetical protein ACI4OI_00600, partial [Gemmiger sp.]
MNKLQELNQTYLQVAEKDPVALQETFEKITEYMKMSTAIHHGEYVRTCYKPKLFTETDFRRFQKDIGILYGIFGKVMDAYFTSPSYRELFGFDAVT